MVLQASFHWPPYPTLRGAKKDQEKTGSLRLDGMLALARTKACKVDVQVTRADL